MPEETPTGRRRWRVILLAFIFAGCASLPPAVFFAVHRDIFTIPFCFPAVPFVFVATMAFNLSSDGYTAAEWLGLILMAVGAWWLAVRRPNRSAWAVVEICVIILALAALIVAAYAHLLAMRYRA